MKLNEIPGIEFDEERHLYIKGDRVLPSVTQIMEPMSLILYRDVPNDNLSIAADRGTRAHESVSNIVKYGIVETDEDTKPYVDAFLSFDRDFGPQWVESEFRVWHRTMGYAGTMDLLGYVEPDDGTGLDVIDIKTTAQFHPVLLAVQVSAYAEALKSWGVKIRKRYGLQLIRTGQYRFEEVKDQYKLFLHSMAIVNAMKEEKRA